MDIDFIMIIFFTQGEKGSVVQKGSAGENGQKGIPGTCDATVLR